LVFINWGIILLYSTKFVDVNGMIYWAVLGMIFKAEVGQLDLNSLPKEQVFFFWSELVAITYTMFIIIVFSYGD